MIDFLIYTDLTKVYTSKSSTYVKNGKSVSLSYLNELGLNFVRGFLSADTVTIAGLRIKNQTFTQVTSLTDNLIPYDNITRTISGIFGLGYPSLANTTKAIPPFQNMIKQKLVPLPIFSFWLPP